MQNTVPSSDASVESNIIQFPINNKNFLNSASLEELMEQATQNRIDFVDFVVGDVMEELFYKLNMIGFHFDDDIYTKDAVFVSEALKSLMLKTMGIDHGMQIAAEKLIDFKSDSENID